MLFNSITFLTMLILTLSIYWMINDNLKIKFIFFSSLIFYGFWRFEFIFLILLSAIVDYYLALKIFQSSKKLKKRLLVLSIFFNLSILFIFKYLNFFVDNAFSIIKFFGYKLDPILFNIILPLGISFYTFHTIIYKVDVYRGVIKPEKSFFNYAAYVTFFPQLIAGPILRAGEVIPQFLKMNKFNLNSLYKGLQRVIYGLFLKVVFADNISYLVDQGFSTSYLHLSGFDVWTLAFLFGFQIYFDFSAYSHIAIGCARMFGLKFPENFNFPYMSRSPKEFWKRWHISLSSWIRDYLYLPLSKIKSNKSSTEGIGGELSVSKSNLSLFITWGIMGFWHGANWTFFLWGIFHSFVIYLYRIISKVNNHNLSFIKNFGFFITMPVIMLGWIPFRSTSLENFCFIR